MKLEYNIATKIFETISRLNNGNNLLQKSSVDVLSKNYLLYEIIKSKNLHSLANHQIRYIKISDSRFMFLITYVYILFILLTYNLQYDIFIGLLFLTPLFVAYYLFLKTQFFLWDNDIISNFIHLLLKNSFSESQDEIKIIFRLLAYRLDEQYIQYLDQYWCLDSIRKELAEVIRYYLCPNINEVNKDKILNFLERISIFLATYSIEQYKEMENLITDVKVNLNEVKPIKQKRTPTENLLQVLTIGILPVVSGLSDIIIKTAQYWILAAIIGGLTYYKTNNLQFTGFIIAFSGSIFNIYKKSVDKPK